MRLIKLITNSLYDRTIGLVLIAFGAVIILIGIVIWILFTCIGWFANDKVNQMKHV